MQNFSAASELPVERVELCPGYQVSRLIKGGWQTVGRGADAVECLLEFVRAGITTFETSDSYAGGEALMGALLNVAQRTLPSELADEIKVHTRFTASVRENPPNPGDVVASVDRSLVRIGVERLELLQLQWWNLDLPGMVETGHVLARLQLQGKIGRIGVTNFGVAPLRKLLDAGVPVSSNQVHHSLIDRRAETALADFCASGGIGLLAYGPLAGGLLSERWLGAAKPIASHTGASQEYLALVEAVGGWGRLQALLRALSGIAARRKSSISVVALSWALGCGPGKALLFGATGRNRLPELLAACKLRLSEQDLEEIASVGLSRFAADVGELERVSDSVFWRAIRRHHA